MDLLTHAHALKTAQTISEVRKGLVCFARLLEVEYYLFCLFQPKLDDKSDMTLIHNYPDVWMSHYLDNQLIDIDPVAIHCRTQTAPLMWQDMKKNRSLSKPGKQLLNEASETGLKHGLSIPVHGTGGAYGLLSLCSESVIPVDRMLFITLQMQMFVPFLHECIVRINAENVTEASDEVTLTKREIECLKWASAGKTSWEISKILNISERTAIFHLTNATTKTRAVNRQHAIAKAILMGLF